MRFIALEQTPREISESLEQLRVIEHGYKIKLVETSYHAFPIDTEADLIRANNLIMDKAEG